MSGRRGGRLTSTQARLLDKATAVPASSQASLSDIEHVVILMQENRSFDHYFGTLSGRARVLRPGGANPDRRRAAVPGLRPVRLPAGRRRGRAGYLQPFHLLSNPPARTARRTNDITHNWGPQHRAGTTAPWTPSSPRTWRPTGPQTGRSPWATTPAQELAFYYALADAFTVCDGYHCSVLGPTDPNRLMAMSASIDPDGAHGGPVVETFSDRLASTASSAGRRCRSACSRPASAGRCTTTRSAWSRSARCRTSSLRRPVSTHRLELAARR